MDLVVFRQIHVQQAFKVMGRWQSSRATRGTVPWLQILVDELQYSLSAIQVVERCQKLEESHRSSFSGTTRASHQAVRRTCCGISKRCVPCFGTGTRGVVMQGRISISFFLSINQSIYVCVCV